MKIQKQLGFRGFGLLDALVIAALLAAMVGASASYYFQRSKQAKLQESKMTVSQFHAAMKSEVNQISTVRKSESLKLDQLH